MIFSLQGTHQRTAARGRIEQERDEHAKRNLDEAERNSKEDGAPKRVAKTAAQRIGELSKPTHSVSGRPSELSEKDRTIK